MGGKHWPGRKLTGAALPAPFALLNPGGAATSAESSAETAGDSPGWCGRYRQPLIFLMRSNFHPDAMLTVRHQLARSVP
jgi:hypothetical protein